MLSKAILTVLFLVSGSLNFGVGKDNLFGIDLSFVILLKLETDSSRLPLRWPHQLFFFTD